MATISDVLTNPGAGNNGLWVGLVNNATSVAYKSTGVTASNGLFTVTAPNGIYTSYTSPSGTGLPPGGAWTATGDTAYVVPSSAATQTILTDLFDNPNNQDPIQTDHQCVPTLIASGTFVAPDTSYALRMEISGLSQGTGAGILYLAVGVNGGVATGNLFDGDLNAGGGALTAAAGVTEFSYSLLGACAHEPSTSSTISKTVQLGATGANRAALTAGRTYTWQIWAVVAQGYLVMSPTGRGPFSLAPTPDGRIMWVANWSDSTVQATCIGGQQGWLSGAIQSTRGQAAGTPVAVAATNPIDIAVTPDGNLVVAISGAAGNCILTVINAKTRQVIASTQAISSTSANAYGNNDGAGTGQAVTITQNPVTPGGNDYVAWVTIGALSGKIYPVTLSLTAGFSAVGHGTLIRNSTDSLKTIVQAADGTLWVGNVTAQALYPVTLTSPAVVNAVGSPVALTTNPSRLAACQTAVAVAAGITLTSATFDLTTTVIPGKDGGFGLSAFGVFPPRSQLKVPISGGYVTLTYNNSTVSGTTRTFHSCTGGGNQTTIAANAVIDETVWCAGNANVYAVKTSGIIATYAPTSSFTAIGIDVSEDGAEVVWFGQCVSGAYSGYAGYGALSAGLLGQRGAGTVGYVVNKPETSSFASSTCSAGRLVRGFVLLALLTHGATGPALASFQSTTFTIDYQYTVQGGFVMYGLGAA